MEEILKTTTSDQWRYCPTHENPSDVGTRRIGPVKFDNRKLWKKGLREDKSMWPANQRSSATEGSEKEKVNKFEILQVKEGVTFDLEQAIDNKQVWY